MSDKVGVLEIIIGGMFGGKTSELVRRLRKKDYVKQTRCAYVNSAKDDRNESSDSESGSRPTTPYSTHNKVLKEFDFDNETTIQSYKTDSLMSIVEELKGFQCVGVDEAQFFDEDDLNRAVRILVNEGCCHVIVASLNGDFERNVFGGVYRLLPEADSISLEKGWCVECANRGVEREALFSHRVAEGNDVVQTGGEEDYVALCRGCRNVRG